MNATNGTNGKAGQPYLTVKQLADLLQVTTTTVYRMVEAGRLPTVRIGAGKRSIRFSPCDIERYLETVRVGGPAGKVSE